MPSGVAPPLLMRRERPGVYGSTGPGQPYAVGTFPFTPRMPVSNHQDPAPTEFALDALYPNPASATATIRYDVATAATVEIAAFDLLGRRVLVLWNGEHAPGRYATPLNTGSLTAGSYVIRAEMRPADGSVRRTFSCRLTVMR